MKFLKKNIWTVCSWALVFVLASSNAFAVTGNDVMGTAAQKARDVFSSVKTITFIVGAFGLVGIAYQAIIGKVKWGWFAGLAVGLALLAAAGSIVEYATGDSTTQAATDTFGDI